MTTIDDIFEALEGPAKLARRIGVTTEHAAAMRRRGSIPARYWPALLASGDDVSAKGITYAALASIAASRKPDTAEALAS